MRGVGYDLRVQGRGRGRVWSPVSPIEWLVHGDGPDPHGNDVCGELRVNEGVRGAVPSAVGRIISRLSLPAERQNGRWQNGRIRQNYIDCGS